MAAKDLDDVQARATRTAGTGSLARRLAHLVMAIAIRVGHAQHALHAVSTQ